MSNQFPVALPDWSNLAVIHRNTLPPRSYFFLYHNEADALAADVAQSASMKLSGKKWKFFHSNSPFESPQIAEGLDLPTPTWQDINVPGMWQLQGFGAPHYTNVVYPFPVDPPHVPYDNNQTGTYCCSFTVPTEFTNQKLRLRFEGVDSAFHVYINGKEIGYSQGARNPSEFDITDAVDLDGSNELVVKVYQFCDGSYIEDQDQWWLSGIFRDVYLHAFPKSHIQDFHCKPMLDDSYQDGTFEIDVQTIGDGVLQMKLYDSAGELVAEQSCPVGEQNTTLRTHVIEPRKWSAEDPYLYTVVLSYGDRFVSQRIGFRSIEIEGGLYLVNGKRIVFRGANRHEHHPESGRAVPYDFLRRDLLLMKTHNINAIRTSHQPSDPRLYDLADELGLWVMDEADLECHGFSTIDEATLLPEQQALSFDKKKILINKKSSRFTSDNPEWEDAYVDRARQLVMRDRNHACVVMWSLGNEAFYGRNFQAMYDCIKSIDTSRPVHYEGDFDAETVDLYSQMYSSVEDIIKFAEEPNFTKPLVLCEFIHAMGNGPGNIKEYIDAFYKYPRLQGGWVWEWANHGLLTKTVTGESYYAYGGDFGDTPHDGNFVMDGVLDSSHSPTPGLLEYKKAIEPVSVHSYDGVSVTVVNRYDLITLDHLKCELRVVGDGIKTSATEISIPVGIAPGSMAQIPIPEIDTSKISSEVYYQFDFSLKQDANWAQAGHIVASSQIQTRGPTQNTPTQSTSPAPQATQIGTTLHIQGTTSKWQINLVQGTLTSWLKSSTQLIHNNQGPSLDFYRALTDNDRPQDGQEWRDKTLHQTRTHVRQVTWSSSSPPTTTPTTQVTITSRIAPPIHSWSITTTTTYTFHPNDTLSIHVKGQPSGPNAPSTLARLGFTFHMPPVFNTVSWFGRGPGQSYKDSKMSQHMGNYTASVEELFTYYEFPQEGGNRSDVRHVTISSNPSPSPTASSLMNDLKESPPSLLQSSSHPFPFIKSNLPPTPDRAHKQQRILHGIALHDLGHRPVNAPARTAREKERFPHRTT